MLYQPSQKILDKYADVLINYGLNNGKGIKRGEVVFLHVPESAKPLLMSLHKAVLKAGAYFITQFIPDNVSRQYYEIASNRQLSFFPAKFLKGKTEQADHFLFIIAEADKHELEGINPRKIMLSQKAFKPYMEWRDEKENKGKLSWTLAMYGTEAMAKEAGLSLKEYWNQIVKACYLDVKAPVAKWRQIQNRVDKLMKKLDRLKIEKLHIKSKSIDLTVGLGKNRKWLGGTGANIPSFEVYISPDARATEGHIKFNQPLYRYGNLVKGIYLEFKNGEVVKAKARKGEKILKEMIAVKGADRVGEYSLTDKRFSRISKFMAETLFDENFGGKYGNTHIALGNAYKNSYPGNPSKVSKKQWEKMGYNESVVHTDIISTEDRIVTAFLANGKKKIIYRNGKFVI